MKSRKPATLLPVLLSTFLAVPVSGHHEIVSDMNLASPLQIVGEIAAVNWGDPHSSLQINIARENQPDQEWLIQIDSAGELISKDIGANEIRAGDWVAVVLFLSAGSDCENRCVAYGLSLTDEDQNSYTLSQEVYDLFVQYKRQEA